MDVNDVLLAIAVDNTIIPETAVRFASKESLEQPLFIASTFGKLDAVNAMQRFSCLNSSIQHWRLKFV